MEYRTIHRNCGGIVKKRKCLKCGKKWGKLGSLFTGDIVEEAVRFDEEGYRRRIREKRDIYK